MHHKNDYVSRKSVGRGHARFEDCVIAKVPEPIEYTKKSKLRLLTAAIDSNNKRNNIGVNTKTIEKHTKWEEKEMDTSSDNLRIFQTGCLDTAKKGETLTEKPAVRK